jgi:hypothetical protein
MKKLFLLLILFSASAIAQSTNALVIRKQSDNTLITVKLPNPNLDVHTSVPGNFKDIQLPTDVQAYVALLLSTTITGPGSSQIPIGSNFIIIYRDELLQTYVVNVFPDNGLGSPCSGSCSYVSFTGSLNATLGAVLDKLYLGL